MNKLTQRFWLASTAAVVLTGASFAAMARGGHDGCDEAMNGPRSEHMQQRMQDHMAKRQADLKASLKLTTEQEAAWNAYTTAVKPPAMESKNLPNRDDMSKLTTPQRMEKMQAMKVEREAHMGKVMEATKTFYGSLTPEQQKLFDEQTLRGPMGGHGGKGGRMGGQHRHG